MTTRREDDEERRSTLKTRTCSAEQAAEPDSISISLLEGAKSTCGNVLGDREHVETGNEVDLVPRCATEEELQMEGNVSEKYVPYFCVQEEPVDNQTKAAAPTSQDICMNRNGKGFQSGQATICIQEEEGERVQRVAVRTSNDD